MTGQTVSRRNIFSFSTASRKTKFDTESSPDQMEKAEPSSEKIDKTHVTDEEHYAVPGPIIKHDTILSHEENDSHPKAMRAAVPLHDSSIDGSSPEKMKLARAKRSLACFSTSLNIQNEGTLVERDIQPFEQRAEQSEFTSRPSYSSSLSSSGTSCSSISTSSPQESLVAEELETTKWFGADVRRFTHDSPDAPSFDKELRSFIEPHIAKARKIREKRREEIVRVLNKEKESHEESSSVINENPSRHRQPQHLPSVCIASNIGVPYPQLRQEQAFLFDVETYPLHHILAKTLGVEDLSMLHEHQIRDKREILKPLLDPTIRKEFHKCYDNFVTSLCIPELHSEAMRNGLFHSSDLKTVKYRYQAFPCLRVVRPGEFSIGPHCDMSYGHSLGNLNFHIPLTPTYGTNAIFTERRTGREDWHPLTTKSFGLGYRFDGARCLHFTLENTTKHTRVSIDFRIAICRDNSSSPMPSPVIKYVGTRGEDEIDGLNHHEEREDDVLSDCRVLKDNYSKVPGYYEEAFIALGTDHLNSFSNLAPGPVVYKKNKELLHPDKRVGFPF